MKKFQNNKQILMIGLCAIFFVLAQGKQANADEACTISATITSGTYNHSISLEIESSNPAGIYYTTDGSDPTLSSYPYYGNMLMGATNQIVHMKATSFCGEGAQSEILDLNYVFEITPEITEATPIPEIVDNSHPTYTFSSTMPGTIHYMGNCSSSTTDAIEGDNTLVFQNMANGVHSNCGIYVSNANGDSNYLSIRSFTINATIASVAYAVVNKTKSAATILVQTDNASHVTIYYGTNKNKLSRKKVDDEFSTDHSIRLSGLKKNKKYYFRILFYNDADNKYISRVLSFKTRNK
jgi:hypothetical protein